MVEIVLELLLQLFGETLVDIGLHALGDSSRVRRVSVRVVLYAAVGAAAGAMSLLLFPDHFIRNEALRLASLCVVPVVAGIGFAAVGRRRKRNAKDVTALESFWPAFSLALGMAVVRYFAAA